MHPALTLIGHGPVPAYELMLALGACVLVAVVAGSAARETVPRTSVFVWVCGTYLAAIAGARASFAALRLPAWDEALAVLSSPGVVGFSSVGGLVVGALAAWWLGRRLDLPLARLASPLLLGGCLFAAIARVGCFLAGCCHGRPTDLPWGVVYPAWSAAATLHGPDVAVHPSPLYEAALLLALAAWVAWPAASRSAGRAAAAAGAYLAGRFALDFLRGDPISAGLTPAQWLAVGVFVVGLAVAGARVFSARREHPRFAGGVSLS